MSFWTLYFISIADSVKSISGPVAFFTGMLFFFTVIGVIVTKVPIRDERGNKSDRNWVIKNEIWV